MNRSKLETLVLVAGVLVIGGALALMLSDSQNPKLGYYTNIVFAIGFLIYIVYNIMSTNSLQKEIRAYVSQVDALKQDLQKERGQREQAEKELAAQKAELHKLSEALAQSQKSEAELKQALAEAQTERPENP